MASNSNNKRSQRTPKPTKKSSKIEAKAPVEPSNSEGDLTIVGIGASAGGLEALQAFFDALRSDTNMAFVVITHLHPEHKRHMAELLQRHTHMPTRQVTKKTKVQANQRNMTVPMKR